MVLLSLRLLATSPSSFNLTVTQMPKDQTGNVVRSSKLILPAAHLSTFLHLSNDDHSYFVRWKLPTETLEVFDDNKWLRLSSPTSIQFAVFTMGSKF